jgi:hypothetical protein
MAGASLDTTDVVLLFAAHRTMDACLEQIDVAEDCERSPSRPFRLH